MTICPNAHASLKTTSIRNPSALAVTPVTLDLIAQRGGGVLRGEGRTPPFRELDRRVRSAIRRDSRADIEQKLRAEGSGALYRAVRPLITFGRSSAAHFLSATPDQLGKHLFCDRQASGPVLQPTTRASGYRLMSRSACREWMRVVFVSPSPG